MKSAAVVDSRVPPRPAKEGRAASPRITHATFTQTQPASTPLGKQHMPTQRSAHEPGCRASIAGSLPSLPVAIHPRMSPCGESGGSPPSSPPTPTAGHTHIQGTPRARGRETRRLGKAASPSRGSPHHELPTSSRDHPIGGKKHKCHRACQPSACRSLRRSSRPC